MFISGWDEDKPTHTAAKYPVSTKCERMGLPFECFSNQFIWNKTTFVYV